MVCLTPEAHRAAYPASNEVSTLLKISQRKFAVDTTPKRLQQAD